MFHTLSDAQVIPREAFAEWWRVENVRNEHGMILKNSQINRFMDTINQDGESSADSSDEKSETIPSSTAAADKD